MPLPLSSPTPSIPELIPLHLPLSTYEFTHWEALMSQQYQTFHHWTKQKVTLVCEIYDLIDNHIRRLDTIQKKYEAKLRKNAPDVPATPIDRRRAVKRGLDPEAREIQYLLQDEIRKDIARS